jgi:uncharacterized coiled-coil DUF342 family protein
MNNVKIDTEKLNASIANIKKYNEKMAELFDEIKSEEKALEDFWITEQSNEIYIEFNNMYSLFDEYKEKNNTYVTYLENYVSQNYTDYDESVNKLVDTKITTD